MIDFHTHILPKIDDGAESISESLGMLQESLRQGVDVMVATSHFYADEEDPESFLRRRNRAYAILRRIMQTDANVYPKVVLGAEVLYFPGISRADGVEQLCFGKARCILVEPPMVRWTDSMLDEIQNMGNYFQCTPVIAHVDRYMAMLKDETLINRVCQRGMYVQVNADYFCNPKTQRKAMQNLRHGKIHLLGSDCHNLTSRVPNIQKARSKIRDAGLFDAYLKLRDNAEYLLKG